MNVRTPALYQQPGAWLTCQGVNMPDATCSVNDCEQPPFSRGWCSMHYQRNWKTGDLTLVRRGGRPPRRECLAEDCERKSSSHGFCGMHADRIRRRGTPFPAIPGYKRGPQPQVSNPANVYVYATHNGKSIGAHRVAMEAIIGRALLPGENVHHRNGVRYDNRPENLELWSRQQPAGQRVTDKVEYAVELLMLYAPHLLA